ncbi:Putative cytochrome P450 135A1 (modular protein) [metagenome]|uniref:Cytochrome P450 135A1 (Modular protein) n=1 Tax=metagenome TaxID=256318 RepID=A0A2P2BZW4_9ZZZZ
MPDDFRCSAASRVDEESMAGTAPTEAAFLLVEYAGSWARDAPSVLTEHVSVPAGVRPQLIRRHRARVNDRTTVFAAWRTERGFAVETTSLGGLSELADLDLEALAAGRSPGLTPYDDLLWLVCTNGRRDVCCAEIGRPVAAAVAGLWPEATWETTHLGGHRFAGTLLALPSGITLGRLDAESAVVGCRAVADGRHPLELSRGRAGMPTPVQAAELHLAAQPGPDLTFLDASDDGALTRVRFDRGSAVVRTQPGTSRRQSCADLTTKPAPVHTVTTLAGLPPGPSWPVIVQSMGLLRFRHRFVPYLRRRYGDTFTVKVIPRGRPLVLFTRPEHTREIFAADPEVFHAGKGNAILGPIMGEHSLLLQDGADHQRARKLLMPAFNGHALHGYQLVVSDLARAEVDRWHDGEEFRSLDRMNAITLEVILRVVFGVTDESRLAALRPRVRTIVNVSPALLAGAVWPWLLRFGPWRAQVTNRIELDRLIYAEIAERRAAADLGERTDVLSRLLAVGAEDGDALSDAELRDQLVTLLLAGHETTATALSWALYELGRSPELRERARAGGDAYLEAVMKESLRLHPVIAMVVRTVMKPASIAGIDLPVGTTVGPSILLNHADGEQFPDPDEFRPERFLGTSPATNTWIPFGGGVRRCIGAGFSLMEGVAVLREVLWSWDVDTVGVDEPKVRNITSVPRRGARIRVTLRAP